ncbi:uncharacterized protein LOC129001804 [Macrosteles quadrilineatus]|uniref:uncharacterized protein LOC129001804 n=1 Tax=Macrosteles quadrilineatus TaxID=74068 RepID=UPI0023E202CE|nr:uncharacterized protein LOC129001804 [Macrosteles quadrilineatus]
MKSLLAIVFLGLAAIASVSALENGPRWKFPKFICSLTWGLNVYNPVHYVVPQFLFNFGWNKIYCPLYLKPMMRRCDKVGPFVVDQVKHTKTYTLQMKKSPDETTKLSCLDKAPPQ